MMTVNPDESLAPTQKMQGTRDRNTLAYLLAETGQYLAPDDLEKIQRAYELANRAHMGVTRRSGEPYILHPLEVALLLADMRIDANGIAAALLHDVVEDTTYSLEDLQEQFGKKVATIVDGVTKFNTLVPSTSLPDTEPLSTSSVGQAEAEQTGQEPDLQIPSQAVSIEAKQHLRSETVRKMLLATAEDPRVVVLKLADRLHNMRTLGAMKPVQQQNTARETSEIYAPLARRLGMMLVQAELEDLSLFYLEPEKYARLAHDVEEERKKRQPYIDKVCHILEDEMKRAGIKAEVTTWHKHLASINRKLQQSNGDISQIHDFVSFRILVDSDHDCYLALGHIHALWRPKDGRIKDFIATPKLNGYQSLHTTVFCLDNHLAEIQIRTHDMQRTADYGIASYWYLRSQVGSHLSYHEMSSWIEQLREWQHELPQNADEFVEAVKGDIFQEQIFVFTPKGEVKDLPRGSTPLDMAYRIHTDIGDHCAGARIITNTADTGRLVTRLVPLDYELQGGEIVDIVTSRKAHPTGDWLSFARTTAARTKIRRYLKTYEREINQQLGRERLDSALKAAGLPDIEVILDEDVPFSPISKKYPTLEDVYVALGRGDLQIATVIAHLVPLLQNRGEFSPALELEKEIPLEQSMTAQEDESSESSVLLPSIQEVIKLAHCCCPMPDDSIIGSLHPNKGMFVHRKDCRTLRRNRQQAKERLIDISWAQIEPQYYLAPISITAHDRSGLLRDVAAVVADAGINMTAVSSTTNASLQKAVITATLEVEQLDQIEQVFKRLRQIKNVVSVSRSPGRHLS
ncbi:MAG: bifunctional (p)ppGpp synthetase/guanosine-3',5'-bis(diphosphate) 3'-pyrophosphohydrolase [Chloroflexota bacterium]|nr:bifunctional (p)ppGpp synthetase/guanosine-3',5'-bis(diphosphate) 3'-pyrophosphohydrolase [Chloroflexota bacterium]